ncbi:MAG: phosphoribosyl-ATP diphosphatase, partial [Bacteroidetes bacterium]|nr:phosphoribosyl-ATP diphosphatase [Bacteroidota bacterium]
VTGLEFLEAIILDRKKNPKEGSYTNHLLSGSVNKVAQKVGEEAVELVIEAKDRDTERFLNEAADLMYHFLVLLAHKGHTLKEVTQVLHHRHKA